MLAFLDDHQPVIELGSEGITLSNAMLLGKYSCCLQGFLTMYHKGIII